MIQFAHAWIFLLLPLPWLVARLLPPRVVEMPRMRVPFGARLDRILGPESEAGTARDGEPPLLKWVVWILLLAALARPQVEEEPISKTLPTRDLLLLVDLSGSMQAEDFATPEGEAINRLDAVKGVVGDFLAKREGDRVGLVVFGDAPFLQTPFTTDLALARQLLDETEIGMAGPRTALGDAIGLGIHLFEESEVPAKTIIALTDGNDTKSQVPPIEAARIASGNGITIHTVAIGDPTSVGEEKLDEEALRQVATAADGSYFFAADREELEKIYDTLDRIETREIQTVSHRPRRDLFPWPLLAALLLSLAARALHLRRHHLVQSARPPQLAVHRRSGKLELVEQPPAKPAPPTA